MMRFDLRSLSLMGWLASTLQPAFAGQPPDPVGSDEYENTAMGHEALYNLTPSITGGVQYGNNNTAAGDFALQANTTGGNNSAFGDLSLSLNVTGSNNTAMGFFALAVSTGSNNTAVGSGALAQNTAGIDNTASGYQALYSNTAGNYNTASGFEALYANTTGSYNTAYGLGALVSNTTGAYNTASGNYALQLNTTGNSNTASGLSALENNSTGANNTAFGYNALFFNTTGKGNAAQGVNALYSNTTGIRNLGIGNNALYANSTGSYNIGLGFEGGYNITSGSNNIDIANPGESADGVAANSGVIRIGTQSPTALQSRTYIAGIYDNTSVSGLAIVIDSNGQLGTVSSSERFKTDIEPLGSSAEKLQQLRPVTFRYRADAGRTLRYGLIAEEVAKIYPELVVRDRNGRIDGVRYDELTPMLLNEMQKQQRINAVQAEQNTVQAAKIASLEQQLAGIQVALVELQSKDQLAAQR